ANCAGQHDHDRRQDTKPCQARASEYDGCPSDSIVDSLIGVRILKRACLKALERQQPKYQVRQTNEQKSKEQNKRDIPKKAARSTVINHCTSSLYLSICGMVPPGMSLVVWRQPRAILAGFRLPSESFRFTAEGLWRRRMFLPSLKHPR